MVQLLNISLCWPAYTSAHTQKCRNNSSECISLRKGIFSCLCFCMIVLNVPLAIQNLFFCKLCKFAFENDFPWCKFTLLSKRLQSTFQSFHLKTILDTQFGSHCSDTCLCLFQDCRLLQQRNVWNFGPARRVALPSIFWVFNNYSSSPNGPWISSP